ncbi:MAG: hypothetical protein GX285_05110 [Clostridiales bacterium]|nr:hypothetical protein [Clostridiales bacterium]
MKKDLYDSNVIQILILLMTDLQSEYSEILEGFIAASHIAEQLYCNIKTEGLPHLLHYFQTYLSCFFS